MSPYKPEVENERHSQFKFSTTPNKVRISIFLEFRKGGIHHHKAKLGAVASGARKNCPA
jgi:hypothetical protein